MLERVDVEVSTNGVIDGEMDSVLAVDDIIVVVVV